MVGSTSEGVGAYRARYAFSLVGYCFRLFQKMLLIYSPGSSFPPFLLETKSRKFSHALFYHYRMEFTSLSDIACKMCFVFLFLLHRVFGTRMQPDNLKQTQLINCGSTGACLVRKKSCLSFCNFLILSLQKEHYMK